MAIDTKHLRKVYKKARWHIKKIGFRAYMERLRGGNAKIGREKTMKDGRLLVPVADS